MPEIAAIEKEKELLRDEIISTKRCQVQFFIVSITAFGALLEYILANFYKNYEPNAFKPMYLVPLCILLPMWLIFVYKTITITRMVGYYMILEEAIYSNFQINFIFIVIPRCSAAGIKCI